MPGYFITCEYCGGRLDRRYQGKCPHCDKALKRQIGRQCPACEASFRFCTRKDKKRYCPACGVEIYYPGGARQGQTLLALDKDTALQVVEMLEQHISHRESLIFLVEGSERNVELRQAYAFLDRSKTFLKRNNSDLSPHEFTVEVIKRAFEDKYWSEHIVTLKQLHKDIARLAMELYRDKKRNAAMNKSSEQTFVNFNAYSVVWD